VVFGVVNTMGMSVLERTREIGTMMALGLTRARIGAMFVAEGAILAVLGGGLGVLAARLVVTAIGWSGGFEVAAPGQEVARYALVPLLYPPMVLFSLLGAIVGAIGASMYPAWRVSKMRPVEALRAA